jgi:hypothetical protein
MKSQKWFFGLVDNSEKGDVSGHFEQMPGYSLVALRFRNAADYRLPTFGPQPPRRVILMLWQMWVQTP